MLCVVEGEGEDMGLGVDGGLSQNTFMSGTWKEKFSVSPVLMGVWVGSGTRFKKTIQYLKIEW